MKWRKQSRKVRKHAQKHATVKEVFRSQNRAFLCWYKVDCFGVPSTLATRWWWYCTISLFASCRLGRFFNVLNLNTLLMSSFLSMASFPHSLHHPLANVCLVQKTSFLCLHCRILFCSMEKMDHVHTRLYINKLQRYLDSWDHPRHMMN